jgi:hypothetical protein
VPIYMTWQNMIAYPTLSINSKDLIEVLL